MHCHAAQLQDTTSHRVLLQLVLLNECCTLVYTQVRLTVQGKTPIHLIIEEYRCTCSGGLSFLVHSNNGKSAMQTKDKAVRDSGALTNRLRPGDKADCLCQFGNYFTCS